MSHAYATGAPAAAAAPSDAMTIEAHGYAATAADLPMAPFTFARRSVRPDDVKINIKYCGVCHSDLHQVKNEWKNSLYPMVPGHEIVGEVAEVGAAVTKFKAGDIVGVGCMVDSCQQCEGCKKGLEQFCSEGALFTYNCKERDGVTLIQGGYSDVIVVREAFVVLMPTNLNLAAAAPLLCAGITTYSPLRHWNVKAGDKVGVVGLGGLGHMAVKFAKAFGAHVTVFTTSASKKAVAQALGADDVVVSSDAEDMKRLSNSLNFILDTVGFTHDLNPYIANLKFDGSLVLVGAPENPHPPIAPFGLIFGRRTVAGSLIGGVPETQEMLDFCGKHNITCEIEEIDVQYIDKAYERMLKSDVKYRFVINMASLKQ